MTALPIHDRESNYAFIAMEYECGRCGVSMRKERSDLAGGELR